LELKAAPTIGFSKTHGTPLGEKLAISELPTTQMILDLQESVESNQKLTFLLCDKKAA
jgi:hypothetical protein